MFKAIEEALLPIVASFNEYLSSYILIALLVGVGLWFTIRTRAVQVRYFGEGMKRMFGGLSLKGKQQKSGMSSFQALATAIAAQVGTGNIVGASGAILLGGPGAIFWMWVIAFLGMSTIYAEATLAQKTRKVDDNGEVHGGPVYYIRAVFTGKFGKFLAVFFAVAAVLALGLMGPMVQSNSIGETINSAFGIPGWVMGLVLVVLCAFIFFGGTKRLASVVEKVVPIMAGVFILGGLVVLVLRIEFLPATIGMIFKYAFQPQAILGGTFGAAIKAAVSQGAKRGLFSNEAGMGSTPHAHAQANVKHPHEQGCVAMAGVFLDTFIVLTLVALVIVSTMYVPGGELAESGAALISGITKTTLAQSAFGSVFGAEIGSIFVAICLFFFAFSTILGWNLFAKINVQYIFKKHSKTATIVFTVLALGFIFVGTCVSNNLVWELTDAFNYLMVLPNVIALFAMTKVVKNSLAEIDKIKKEEKLAKKAK